MPAGVCAPVTCHRCRRTPGAIDSLTAQTRQDVQESEEGVTLVLEQCKNEIRLRILLSERFIIQGVRSSSTPDPGFPVRNLTASGTDDFRVLVTPAASEVLGNDDSGSRGD